MKTTYIKGLIALTLFFTLSCSNFEGIKGSGKIVSTDRHLTGYNAIKTCCGIDVIITQAETESVRVETDDNLQSYIKTELKDKTLNIYADSGQLRFKTIKVYVQVKKLIKVETSSGADVETTNQLVADSINLSTESGGDMKMDILAKYISCQTTSGSDAVLKGQTTMLEVDVNSGADVKAQGLVAENCKATVTSGSNAKVNVTNQITAEVNSGADISVSGNPKTRNVNKSSGGDIKFE